MRDMLPPPTAASWSFLPLGNPALPLTQDSVLCGVAALWASSLKKLTDTDGLLPADVSHAFQPRDNVFMCSYLLGYAPVCVNASPLKAITLLYVQVRFPISWVGMTHVWDS